MNKQKFEEVFGVKPIYEITTPSRVNLIGEHVDYFDGFSMPVAIENIKMTALMSPRDDQEIWLYSTTDDKNGLIKIDTKSPRNQHQWIQYVQGAVEQFKKVAGNNLLGFNMMIDSSIPVGGGLSSSSALTMNSLIACGLTNGFFIDNQIVDIEKAIHLVNGKTDAAKPLLKTLALAGCSAEWWYGTKGGAMDHFAITVSKQNYATLLDNLDFTYRYVEIPTDLTIVVCNTMVRHNQLYSGYAERKADAYAGFEKIKSYLPKSENSIRNLTIETLLKYENKMSSRQFRRLTHPVTENIRVFAFKKALEEKNYSLAGQILNDAFVSLRDNYDVSCEELNIMQEAAVKSPGCFGARITGGGFGGCIVALVNKSKVNEFMKSVKKLYDSDKKIQKENIKAEVWEIKSSNGIKIHKFK